MFFFGQQWKLEEDGVLTHIPERCITASVHASDYLHFSPRTMQFGITKVLRWLSVKALET